MANVKAIPATKAFHTGASLERKTKRKVAGYARVSTDSDEQLTSYAAQVDYYTNYINRNPEWQFVEVYTDEGISALNTRHREGFNRMIADAPSGKIDLIITKSVSRFARNTVDSLSAIRKLKDHGTEVYFEKEGIWTFDSKGELLITIMSSLAQEESRSISENVTWGQHKRFADGKVTMPYGQFLGYRKGKNGKPEIDPAEAETVRSIYRMFVDGKTVNAIAKTLTEKGVPTPRGKKVWRDTTVESVLTNEKYKGDAILQKSFTVDFLSKKMKKNEGEVPQYVVTDSHPAIIDRNEWEYVQAEMAKRKAKGRHQNSLSPFSAKIYCGECGELYGSKVWHSTDKYRRVVWRCNGKYERQTGCSTPHLSEKEIEMLFMRAISKLHDQRTALIADCEAVMAMLADNFDIEIDRKRIAAEQKTVEALVDALIRENAARPMDQDDYNARYDGYQREHEALRRKLEKLSGKKDKRRQQIDVLDRFIADLREMRDMPVGFSGSLWNAFVEKLTIFPDGRAEFLFRNGALITEEL